MFVNKLSIPRPLGGVELGSREPIFDIVVSAAKKSIEDQGIHQGTIRLSIGLENIDDIIEDLESGFKALRESGLAK